ncbi:hypothetical protein Tco_0482632 [Tanacetum coccineum]
MRRNKIHYSIRSLIITVDLEEFDLKTDEDAWLRKLQQGLKTQEEKKKQLIVMMDEDDDDEEGPSVDQTRTKLKEGCSAIADLKRCRYLATGLEELVPSLWVEEGEDANNASIAVYGIRLTLVLGNGRKFYINNQWSVPETEMLHERNADETEIELRTSLYNKGMETRKWYEDGEHEKKKSFITASAKIDPTNQRILSKSRKRFVGGRIRDIDYSADQQRTT